ncbi:GDP-mannose pyrophosphatase NudK [Marinomonas primoryensis]|uniref:GDP-mannose pyrophosphatase n=1 Tax=Marinomonas primoryensis TaxID=178399 RepID=A0ABV0L1R4_9GAMM
MSTTDIRNMEKTLLSDSWYTLNKFSFELKDKNGQWQHQEREAYDRGNGATILLYNTEKKTVVLTRQFRLPTYVNGNHDGMLIESCAGLLDQDNPKECIKRETHEETGFHVESVTKIFEAYMSPGSVTEMLYFFVAQYSDHMKVSDGGGLEHEQENIEVLELDFQLACSMMDSGEIKDGKTIMLLQYVKLKGLL